MLVSNTCRRHGQATEHDFCRSEAFFPPNIITMIYRFWDIHSEFTKLKDKAIPREATAVQARLGILRVCVCLLREREREHKCVCEYVCVSILHTAGKVAAYCGVCVCFQPKLSSSVCINVQVNCVCLSLPLSVCLRIIYWC